MKVSKVSNRSRRRAKGKGVKKMRARVPIEHGNAGHIHTLRTVRLRDVGLDP